MRKAVIEKKEKNKEKIKKVTGKLAVKIKISKQDIIVLILIAIVIATIILVKNYATLGIVINKNITSEDAVQIGLDTSNNKLIPFNNQILVYSDGKITSYSKHGNNNWTIELEDIVNAEIVTNGKYILVTNKDKQFVYLYKNNLINKALESYDKFIEYVYK